MTHPNGTPVTQRNIVVVILGALLTALRSILSSVWRRSSHAAIPQAVHSRMGRGRVVMLLAMVILAGSIASVVWQLRKPPPQSTKLLSINAALGQVLAEETIKRFGTGGAVVLVTDPNASMATRARAVACQNEMQRYGKLRVIQVAPRNFEATGEITGAQYAEWQDKYANARAIVSLVGLPALDPATTKPTGPPWVVLLSGDPRLADFLQAGLVDLAVVGRYAPIVSAPDAAPHRQMFDLNYQVVTAATAASLPQP
jgi:hypothetical protein